jgi:hypothetical protein
VEQYWYPETKKKIEVLVGKALVFLPSSLLRASPLGALAGLVLRFSNGTHFDASIEICTFVQTSPNT